MSTNKSILTKALERGGVSGLCGIEMLQFLKIEIILTMEDGELLTEESRCLQKVLCKPSDDIVIALDAILTALFSKSVWKSVYFASFLNLPNGDVRSNPEAVLKQLLMEVLILLTLDFEVHP